MTYNALQVTKYHAYTLLATIRGKFTWPKHGGMFKLNFFWGRGRGGSWLPYIVLTRRGGDFKIEAYKANN